MATHDQPFYALPFYADDLNPGERFFTKDHKRGVQELGKDISAVRATASGPWVFTRNNAPGKANEDAVIYGKPFYAMADGEVVGGWRNAPENPEPGEHHEALGKKLMVGGGNHLWILQDDGVYALYAHAQPGSIPKSLCPHSDVLFAHPHDGKKRSPDVAPAVAIPAGSRPRVKKGQFLGRVGNSGSSSGPHLHVHMEQDGKPHLMRFARGLATDWAGGRPDINTWARFAGSKIPDGMVVLWPPHKLLPEFARHHVPVADFQRLFDHLADSGYALEWCDGYSVGGAPFFNVVWRPAQGEWRAFFGQTAPEYQARIDRAKADGLSPVLVESYLSGTQARYAVIFKKVSGAWLARHGLTVDEHTAVLEQARAERLSPVNVSVVSVNNKRFYTVLYRMANIGAWEVKSRLDSSAYQKAVDDNKQAGRTPVYVNAYLHEDTHHYSAVFAEKPEGDFRASHGLTPNAYQAAWTDAVNEGFSTRLVTGIDGAKSAHLFAAVWRK